MMLKNKKIVLLLILLLVMAIFPYLCLLFTRARDFLGIILLFLFIINPLTSIVVGIISGSKIKDLWYFPILLFILFPLFYFVLLKEIIFELYIYSSFYLGLGLISMFISYLYSNRQKKINNNID